MLDVQSQPQKAPAFGFMKHGPSPVSSATTRAQAGQQTKLTVAAKPRVVAAKARVAVKPRVAAATPRVAATAQEAGEKVLVAAATPRSLLVVQEPG